MMATPVWHGTDDERAKLNSAIAHNCECEASDGIVPLDCAAHKMLREDQTTLDRLVFARRIIAALQREEDCIKK